MSDSGPGGGYYGTRKACEPVHVQYAYDDGAVVVVNDTQTSLKGVKVAAQVFDLELKPIFAREQTIDIGPDSVARSFVIPPVPAGTTATYFLRLSLTGPPSASAPDRPESGRRLSRSSPTRSRSASASSEAGGQPPGC